MSTHSAKRNLRDDVRVPDAKADLYLVGLGIGGFDRRSVEADDALRDCSVVLHLTAFDEELRERFSGEVVDLADVYESSDDAIGVYARMAEIVLGYLERSAFLGPVAFVTYGHPLYLVDTGWQLRRSCVERGYRVKALSAPTFVDQALSDLGARFDVGYQCYEARFFYRWRVAVDTRMPLMLAEVGDFGTTRLRDTDRSASRVAPLLDVLQATYPPDRRCALFLLPWRHDMAPAVQWTIVRDLPAMATSVHIASSLFIAGDENLEYFDIDD